MVAAILKNKATQKVILVAVILLLVYLSYKFLGKIKTDFLNNQKAAKNKQELDDLLDQHTTDTGGDLINTATTYQPAQYNLMADALFQAMDGLGTSEESIFAVLSRLRTTADWEELVAAYGIKKASFGNFKGSLVAWLSDELGGSYKVQINNLLGKFNVQI